ncbi:MAG: hypothetical protein OCD02_11885 [Spirochaetaceae bacterium]
MNIIIIEIAVALIPTVYGGSLLIKVNRLSNKMTEEKRVEAYPKISKMKRSGIIFFLAGAYFMYEFYKNHFV